MMPKFVYGQRVRKVGGNYEATGTIVGVIQTCAGKSRFVFEFDEIPGMLHIFTPEQLIPLSEWEDLSNEESE